MTSVIALSVSNTDSYFIIWRTRQRMDVFTKNDPHLSKVKSGATLRIVQYSIFEPLSLYGDRRAREGDSHANVHNWHGNITIVHYNRHSEIHICIVNFSARHIRLRFGRIRMNKISPNVVNVDHTTRRMRFPDSNWVLIADKAILRFCLTGKQPLEQKTRKMRSENSPAWTPLEVISKVSYSIAATNKLTKYVSHRTTRIK